MTDDRHVSKAVMAAALKGIKQMTDDDDTLPDRYTERAGETLAYRLMEYLEFLGVIGKDHVAYLRYPPIELIEDAEKALKDEA
jgi:hypothetical protein